MCKLKELLKIKIGPSKKGDPTEILTKLDKERKDLYENVADYSIKTENKSSQEVASEIISLVKG